MLGKQKLTNINSSAEVGRPNEVNKDVKETGCWRRKVIQWSNCVAGDFGVLAGLASPCPGAAILRHV
jgi:hypothetical protein